LRRFLGPEQEQLDCQSRQTGVVVQMAGLGRDNAFQMVVDLGRLHALQDSYRDGSCSRIPSACCCGCSLSYGWTWQGLDQAVMHEGGK